LLKENASLSNTVKKLNRDVSKVLFTTIFLLLWNKIVVLNFNYSNKLFLVIIYMHTARGFQKDAYAITSRGWW
jgi:hypothetical protein